MKKKENYFKNETKTKGFGFKFILSIVAFMIISFATFAVKRIVENPVQLDPTLGIDPLWYSYSIVILSIITLIGLWLTYMYRKWGVYIVIGALLSMIVINPEYSLLRTLLPMFTLFTFIGYGLFEIIPKWKFFK
ncbi:hypothetical protein KRX57_03355 [Weeksellaceae bacterium TAE3-ERU29]|nr:hypothetical protein [Weeksellaceae bacterium TAE3-ERU29]